MASGRVAQILPVAGFMTARPRLIDEIEARAFLEVIAQKTVELGAGVASHALADLELAPVGQTSTIEILVVDLDSTLRLRREAGVSMVLTRELEQQNGEESVTYWVGDRSDWKEWFREFESGVIYGTAGPA